jgi:MFS family permease
MQKLAQSWLVYKLTGSPFLLGLDAFLGDIPIFLFSLVGGVIADRMDRRRVLLASQYMQMLCAFTLTALVAFHVVQVWQILCLSFIGGLAQAFGGPAYQALIPTLVDKEDMPNAIALNSIQFNVARVIGPALGGLALTKLGDVWCFGLNGLSFFAPILAITVVKARFMPDKTTATILSSMKDGLRFVMKQGSMEALMILAFCMTALGIPMLTFLPVFAKDIFHGGPGVFTLFLSSSGIGSIVGSLTVAWMGNSRRKGLIALTMLICLGASISGFALSHSLWLSCVMLFLAGASLMAVFANVSSLVQLITTDDMRGRVMSVYNVAFRGGMPMGNLATGWLVPIFTAPLVLAVNGVLLVMLGLYFLLGQRRVAAL